jgi:long-subunit fatty acid transport protein
MVSIKKLLLGCTFITFTTSSFSQSGYFEDALRFSQLRSSGSARILGIGGAQTAIGGDISNIHGNPAGLGFYRRSEISFSPSFTNWNTTTNFLNQPQSESTSNLALPNVGAVFTNVKSPLQPGSFRSGSFGISFNRLANLNSQMGYFSNTVSENSILDFFIQDAYGRPTSQIQNAGLTGLAYETFLINPVRDINGNVITSPTTYDSFIIGQPFQDESIITEGGINQTSFSYGANFNHKLFLGAGIGITSINYFSRKTFGEEFINEPLESLQLRENLRINGTGGNITLGVIYKPIEQINLGLNFQSPTFYRLNEEYESSITANYNNYRFVEEDVILNREFKETPIVLGTYNLNTPMKLSVGGTFFIGKSGFITADVDYLDYSTSRINSRDFNATADNNEIIARYGTALNYRVGGEYRYDIFRVRAGYSIYGDPFINQQNIDRTSTQISGGLGVRFKNLYVDFALLNTQYNQIYNVYPVIENGRNVGPFAEIKHSITQGILTVGFNF